MQSTLLFLPSLLLVLLELGGIMVFSTSVDPEKAPQPELIIRQPAGFWKATYVPNSTTVYLATLNQSLGKIDARSNGKFSPILNFKANLQGMALSSNNKLLAVVSGGTRQSKKGIEVDPGEVGKIDLQTCRWERIARIDSHATAIVFIEKEKTIAVGMRLGDTVCFDVQTGEKRAPFSVRHNGVYSLEVLPTSHRLAGGCHDSLKVWDIPSRQTLFSVTMPDAVLALSASSNGKWIAAGCSDGTIAVVSANNGDLIGLMKSSTSNPVRSVRYSPDSSLLAIGRASGELELWDPILKKRHRSVEAHQFYLVDLVFSPDGRWLITCSTYHDETAKLWKVSTLTQD